MDSILTSIKKLLGISEEYEDFDPDIIMCINSVFSVLTQIGVGPKDGFSISNASATWNDYFSGGTSMEAVRNYVAAKVRLMFDPPTSSSMMQALTSVISEFEWRLNVGCDTSTGVIDPVSKSFSYNDLKDIPTLNDVELKGDVRMDIASEKYVDDTIGVVSNGEY